MVTQKVLKVLGQALIIFPVVLLGVCEQQNDRGSSLIAERATPFSSGETKDKVCLDLGINMGAYCLTAAKVLGAWSVVSHRRLLWYSY
jgi:hypothetical protein